MSQGSITITQCALPHVHAMEARSSRAFARHAHDSYGVGLIVGGAQRSWSGRGTVEATQGDVITFNPGEVHDGEPVGSDRTWQMLHLAPALVGEIIADMRDGRSADWEFADPVVQGEAGRVAFRSAFVALTNMAEMASHERLILLLTGLVRERHRLASARTGELERARERIDDDPAGVHSLDDLALEAGLSKFQLVRGFARLTGFTPHAYLVQRRVDVGRGAILAGSTLAEAALAAGFADQSHFTRSFTRRHGVSPAAYAQAIR